MDDMTMNVDVDVMTTPDEVLRDLFNNPVIQLGLLAMDLTPAQFASGLSTPRPGGSSSLRSNDGGMRDG